MRYASLSKRPRHFHTFTGLKVEECDRLIVTVRNDWKEYNTQRLLIENPNRIRKIGGGRKFALPTLEDQILLTLVWAKLYPSYLLLEYLFGVDESTICRTIQIITPLMKNKVIFPDKSRKKISTLEELKEIIPDLDELLADVTEQVIPRPQSKRKRKSYHSGKKRKFTLKTQIATNRKGLILHVSKTVGGRMHDYKLFKKSKLPNIIPKRSTLYVDSGYQGVKKDFPDLAVLIPFKRHRGKKELTHSEKIFNKKQRRIRITVENTIAQLKKYNILNHPYRHSLQNYNAAFRFVANVVNFRMMQRQTA